MSSLLGRISYHASKLVASVADWVSIKVTRTREGILNGQESHSVHLVTDMGTVLECDDTE